MQPESSENSTVANGQGQVKEEKCRDVDCFDLSVIKEEEFDQHVVYIVPDVQTEPNCTNRAEASLPRNLVLKPSQALSDVSHLSSFIIIFTKRNLTKIDFVKTGFGCLEHGIHTQGYQVRSSRRRGLR